MLKDLKRHWRSRRRGDLDAERGSPKSKSAKGGAETLNVLLILVNARARPRNNTFFFSPSSRYHARGHVGASVRPRVVAAVGRLDRGVRGRGPHADEMRLRRGRRRRVQG